MVANITLANAAPDQFCQLPADLQAEVLTDVRWSARATCRAFRNHIGTNALQLQLHWSPCLSPSKLYEIQTMLGRLFRLHTLRANGCYCPSDISLLNALPALTALDLSLSNQLVCFGHLEVACSCLRSLSLSHCVFLRDIESMSNLTTLTSLDLRNCPCLATLQGLPSCLSLTVLDLCDDVRIWDLGPLTTCLHLQFLDLTRCVSVANIQPLATLVALTRLNKSNCYRIRNFSPLTSCMALAAVVMCGLGNLIGMDWIGTSRSSLTSLDLSCA